MPSEERVMRAREVLASHIRPLNKGAAWNILERKDDGYWGPFIAAMLAFADEGSGIGELRVALAKIDAWCCPVLCTNCATNRATAQAALATSAPEQIAENANCSVDRWKPIELLPDEMKDGRYIDVARFMDDFGWIVGVSYWVKDLGGGWISKGTGPFGELGLGHPTHWRSRPAPS